MSRNRSLVVVLFRAFRIRLFDYLTISAKILASPRLDPSSISPAQQKAKRGQVCSKFESLAPLWNRLKQDNEYDNEQRIPLSE